MDYSPVPRIAAIHDLSCFGRAALSVIIPVFSAMGIQVCPLPTALYSTHGLFPGYYSTDLSEAILSIIRHWKHLEISFNAIYSGFIQSPSQVDIFSEFILDFCREDQIVVIDPVFGDQGHIYGMMDREIVERMREYIRLAHIITPNMTEAALLLGEPYRETLSEPTIREWLMRLTECGPKIAVITSAALKERGRDQLGVFAYDRRQHLFWQIWKERLPVSFPGTGDIFTSVMLGRILQGHSLSTALRHATDFLAKSMAHTQKTDTPAREGIVLEQLLHYLNCDGKPFQPNAIL